MTTINERKQQPDLTHRLEEELARTATSATEVRKQATAKAIDVIHSGMAEVESHTQPLQHAVARTADDVRAFLDLGGAVAAAKVGDTIELNGKLAVTAKEKDEKGTSASRSALVSGTRTKQDEWMIKGCVSSEVSRDMKCDLSGGSAVAMEFKASTKEDASRLARLVSLSSAAAFAPVVGAAVLASGRLTKDDLAFLQAHVSKITLSAEAGIGKDLVTGVRMNAQDPVSAGVGGSAGAQAKAAQKVSLIMDHGAVKEIEIEAELTAEVHGRAGVDMGRTQSKPAGAPEHEAPPYAFGGLSAGLNGRLTGKVTLVRKDSVELPSGFPGGSSVRDLGQFVLAHRSEMKAKCELAATFDRSGDANVGHVGYGVGAQETVRMLEVRPDKVALLAEKALAGDLKAAIQAGEGSVKEVEIKDTTTVEMSRPYSLALGSSVQAEGELSKKNRHADTTLVASGTPAEVLQQLAHQAEFHAHAQMQATAHHRM
jgi:VIT1/CCC1 family predicted Fe2+/Mn2+ transporter